MTNSSFVRVTFVFNTRGFLLDIRMISNQTTIAYFPIESKTLAGFLSTWEQAWPSLVAALSEHFSDTPRDLLPAYTVREGEWISKWSDVKYSFGPSELDSIMELLEWLQGINTL